MENILKLEICMQPHKRWQSHRDQAVGKKVL